MLRTPESQSKDNFVGLSPNTIIIGWLILSIMRGEIIMFCPKCGADVGNANFCPKCGYSLGNVPMDLMHTQGMAPQPPTHRPASSPMPAPPKKKKHHAGKIILGTILVVVVISLITTIAVMVSTPAAKLASSAAVSSTTSSSASVQSTKLIVDANKFSNISYQQLSKLMGGPGKKTKVA